MAAWDTPFVSPLQSTTSKTSITQQSSCAQHTRLLERYTHLYLWRWVNWNTQRGRIPGEQQRRCLWSQPLGCGSWACSPKEPPTSRSGGTRDSGLQAAVMPMVPGSSGCRASDPGLFSHGGTPNSGLPPHGGGPCEPENLGYGRDTQKLVSSPSSPPPWWKCLRPKWS